MCKCEGAPWPNSVFHSVHILYSFPPSPRPFLSPYQPSTLRVWLEEPELRRNEEAQQTDGAWSQHTLYEETQGKYPGYSHSTGGTAPYGQL